MDILVIGGGIFLGAAILDSALARGHAVTVFNRGRARSDWPAAGVEAIVGDRSTDLGSLGGRDFDAVIDVCGYVPADLRASAAALASCRRYCFVSSISAYASFAHAPVGEGDPLAASDALAEDDRDRAHYGPQKAACERVVAAAFAERALIVRPGLIVGPRDTTGRFSHWPWRALAGGDILVPDVPPTDPIQAIDVRDLADFIVRAVESGASGAYNATGPQDGRPFRWAELLEACAEAAMRRGGAPLRFVPVAEAYLVEQGVAPWNELPLWVPSTDPEHRGFARVDCSRAVAAGLTTRPFAETVDAVLDEFPTLGADDPRRRGKLTRERERELIARWREHAAGAVVAGEETGANTR